jgi:hypothetical protein
VQHVSSESFDEDAVLGLWSVLFNIGEFGASAAVGAAPPATPAINQLWWSTDLGQLFIYYNDGNSAQWVPASPSLASTAQPRVVYATQFGATFDGVTDDTLELQAFLDAIPEHGAGVMPPGTAIFKSTLTVSGNDKSLIGAGAHTTVLKYAGASTTSDLLRWENPTNWETATKRWQIQDFRITSDTDMTAGAALHLHNVTNTVLYSVIIDGHEGSVRGGDTTKSKLWNGAWFNCVGTVHVYSMTARAFNDCTIVNGGLTGTNGAKADCMFVNGRILQGKVGMRIAGAFGGLSTLGISFQHNDINALVDNSVTAEVNREIFFGSNTWFDTNWDVSVELNDQFASGSAIVQFTDTWIGGNQLPAGRGFGLLINAGCNPTVIVNGGRIWLNKNSGIKIDSTTATVVVRDVQIRDNGTTDAASWGVENNASNTNVTIADCNFFNNGLGLTNNFTNVLSTTEMGSPNQFRVRENIRVLGVGQSTNAINTAGTMAGNILLQDISGLASAGGAVVFGANVGYWGAIRGQLSSSVGNTTGNVVISTRRLTGDAALTESARVTVAGELIVRIGDVVGAGSNAQSFIKMSNANLGIYAGTGDPTFSAGKGSLYTKTNATTTTTRLWVNTDGASAWAFFTASA